MANNFNKNNNFRNNNFRAQNEIRTIDKPLSEYYEDKAKLYLEGGEAYNQAESLKGVKVHQIRKYLSVIKDCSEMTDFEAARTKLYSVVPLAAYNAGRDRSLRGMYDFIKSHINKNTIQSIDDIEVLNQLITSVVAYHKLLGGK